MMSESRPSSSRKDKSDAFNIERHPKLFKPDFIARFTPRSNDAMKAVGALPNELVRKPPSEFQRPGVSKALQKLRYDDHEENRIVLIQQIRDNRAEAIARAAMDRGTSAVMRPEEIAKQKAVKMALEEKARMEAIMRRQAKEIETMVTFEMQMAELLKKQETKLAIRKAREEERDKEVLKQQKQIEVKRRAWEAKRRAAEKKDKEIQAKRTKALFDQEARVAKLKQEEEVRLKRVAAQAVIDAEKKRVEKERQFAEKMAHIREEAELRAAEAARKEQLRKDRIAVEQARIAEVNAKLMEQQGVRKEEVLAQAERVQEAKYQAHVNKMAKQEELRRIAEEKEIHDTKARAAALAKKAQIRKARKAAANANEAGKINRIIDRQRRHAHNKAEIDAKREEDYMLRQELNALNLMKKRRNVARLLRQQQNKRELLLERVNDDMERTAKFEEQKASLLLVRQQNKIQALKQKQQLVQVFATLKKNPMAMLQNDGEEEPPEDPKNSKGRNQQGGGQKKLEHSQSGTFNANTLKKMLSQKTLQPARSQSSLSTMPNINQKGMRRTQSSMALRH